MDDHLGLQGTRVLLFGAGGLGTACARAFADVGAQVAVIDRSPNALEKFADTETRVRRIQHSLVTEEDCQAAVHAGVGALGGLDALVHAVGVNNRKPIVETSLEEWRHIQHVNLETAFVLGRTAGELMVKQGSGRIVFFSSVAGLMAHRNHGAYAASKGGLNQMTRVMAHEWASSGVGVNAVAPGYVETPLTSGYLEQDSMREKLTSLVPAGRLGNADETVGPVLFLASPLSRFVTGQVLYVDGGRTLV